MPLLAFTLAQLADGVGRGGQLSQERYERLGGVQGALTCQADAALADAVTASGRRRDQIISGLWDVRGPRQPGHLGILTGHTDKVTAVAFSADGRTLATASSDSTARLWETNIDSVSDRICGITPAITKSEWDQYLPDLPNQPPCPCAI